MMLMRRMIEKSGYKRIISGQSCERLTILSWRKKSVDGMGKRFFCCKRRWEMGERLIR